jgi:hypothetical protein
LQAGEVPEPRAAARTSASSPRLGLRTHVSACNGVNPDRSSLGFAPAFQQIWRELEVSVLNRKQSGARSILRRCRDSLLLVLNRFVGIDSRLEQRANDFDAPLARGEKHWRETARQVP